MPAASISHHLRRPELVRLIAKLRQRNEENELTGAYADDCDRACRGCGAAEPLLRVRATACYHAVCSECAAGKAVCPLCEVSTSFVRLYEDKSCGICACEAPIDLCGFKDCGHTICGACTLQLYLNFLDKGELISCPFCRTISPPVPIKTRSQE